MSCLPRGIVHLVAADMVVAAVKSGAIERNVVNVLVKAYDLKPIDTVENDVAAIMAGN